MRRMNKVNKKDYIYNGIYLTLFAAYYLLNVEVFNYTFDDFKKETELRRAYF